MADVWTHEVARRKEKGNWHNWQAINKAVITGPFFPDDLSTIYASFSSHTGCGKLVVARNVTRKGRDSDLRFLLLETRPPYVLRVQTSKVPYQLTPSRPRRKRFLPSFLPSFLFFFFFSLLATMIPSGKGSDFVHEKGEEKNKNETKKKWRRIAGGLEEERRGESEIIIVANEGRCV